MGHAAKKVKSGQPAAGNGKPKLVRRGPRRAVGRLTLRTLREATGMSQADVAKASGLVQPEVSKLETAATFDDRMVLTLRRYLATLGDELELVAVSRYGHRFAIVPPEKEGR
jgi:predicted XRE-type DNA-binding protein